MITNKTKIYLLEVLLFIFLFFALFASNIVNRFVVMIGIVLFALGSIYFLKRMNKKSIYTKQVSFLLLLFSLIYIVIFYALGLHYGFVGNKYILSFNTIFKIVLPLSIIIIFSEMLRKNLLSQDAFLSVKKYKFNLSLAFIYICMTLLDLVIYSGVYNLSNLDDFLRAVGYVLFASLSCNLLYNYISSRFGFLPVIIYRLITCLFIYIIPVIPDVYIFMNSFFRMAFPFVVYLVLENTYSRMIKAVSFRSRKSDLIWTSILLVLVSLLIMLISCQFKYGLLVIGSRSMTGTINKGDAVLVVRYDKQKIEDGQVVVFDYNDIKTVHRVISTRRINNENQFVTKGDYNTFPDNGYRKDTDIEALVLFRIKYIGLPTLWLRSLFGI